ncbi:hypothetical protein, partial [Helicobacter bizzozeronii]|uniref:hypothetical protein n=1 Tax=Helicobacter bizzozeronii TaxID=56877 RepID=UPI001F1D35CD
GCVAVGVSSGVDLEYRRRWWCGAWGVGGGNDTGATEWRCDYVGGMCMCVEGMGWRRVWECLYLVLLVCSVRVGE